jgi:hypothetical protein
MSNALDGIWKEANLDKYGTMLVLAGTAKETHENR